MLRMGRKAVTLLTVPTASIALSIVIPCLNEQQSIGECLVRVREVLIASFSSEMTEIILVDDGSTDSTIEIARSIPLPGSVQLRVVSFTRNFGHQVAVAAGIEWSRGKAIAIIDADLQDPPELLPEMVAKLDEGFEVVTGRRVSRDGINWAKKLGYSLFYRLLRFVVLDIDVPLDTGDFRVISRRVADAFNALPERHRFVRGLIPYLGYSHVEIEYDRGKRKHGETKYTPRKLIELAFDGLFSLSTRPLRLSFYLGACLLLLSAVGIIVVMVIRIGTDQWVPGWAGMMILLLGFGGIQFFVLGLIGEYLAKIFLETKARPPYVLRNEVSP